MMVKNRFFYLVSTVGLLLFSHAASAQIKDANELGATDGVLLPSSLITEIDDASATSVNPANLAFLESWHLLYAGSLLQDQERLAGQGHGFFFGMPIGPAAFGISLEPLNPPSDIVQWQGLGERRTRFSLALAANFKDIIGIGIAYRTFWFSSFAPIHTMDLALTVHASNYLAMSFVFSDITSPRFRYRYWSEDDGKWSSEQSRRSPREFNVGLTVRPLGNDRLALGSELQYLHGKPDDQMDTGGSSYSKTNVMAFLSGMPINGLRLKLRFTAEGLNQSGAPDLILDGAVGLDLPNFGVGASFHGQVAPDDSADYQGTVWYASLHGDKGPALPLPRPLRSARAAVLDIESSLDSYGFTRLAETFERIARDSSVDLVLLRPDKKVFSLAQAEEVRADIRRLQKASKKVICYLTEASGAEYLACAGADHLWINPAGGIRMSGVAMTTFYLGDIADKLGVHADIVRIGKYKSAPEVYTKNSPSDATTEATGQYLDDVYASVIDAVQKSRKFKSPETAAQIIEKGPFTASEAAADRLVDETVPKDMIESKIFEIMGNNVFFDTDYATDKIRGRRYMDAPAVAVVHIDGDIIDGETVDIPVLDIKMTGAKTITEVLRQVGGDNRIRAVVLRINSPGGSAMAADIIWREVAALRREKPVIVSMGSLAASGAYYIASAADKIYADSVTLTGSIGIYYGKADLSGFLSRVGINPVTYKRGDRADIQSWTRPYTDDERKQLLRQITQFYNLFLQRVSTGRGRGFTPKTVDKLGQGRIWSGTDAQYYKLADEIGGYTAALKHARSLAGSKEDIRVFHYPKQPKSILHKILSSVSSKVDNRPNFFASVLQITGWGRMLRALAPFAAGDSLSPRARLPFAALEE